MSARSAARLALACALACALVGCAPSARAAEGLPTTAEDDLSFLDDVSGYPRRVLRSAQAIWSPVPVSILGSSAVAAYGVHELYDDDVARRTAEHGEVLPSGLNDALDIAGNPVTHVGLTAIFYGLSFATDDRDLHAFTLDLFDAMTLTNATVFGLKYVFDTTRPDGSGGGFPSSHTASTFSVAGVIDRHYGLAWGLPAYAFGGLMAFHRIDIRKHDVSDVLYGAATGFVMGRFGDAASVEVGGARLGLTTVPSRIDGRPLLGLRWDLEL